MTTQIHQPFLYFPEPYRRSLQRAIEILKEAGCAEIFLFGSLVSGQVRNNSDIDLAIRGCPKGKFFHLLGRLLLEVDYPVDLVDLESQTAFAHYLEQKEELVRVD
ncbi:MAG: nucleotidyltransferase domain-containing protein [Anaerolineae bacterium]